MSTDGDYGGFATGLLLPFIQTDLSCFIGGQPQKDHEQP